MNYEIKLNKDLIGRDVLITNSSSPECYVNGTTGKIVRINRMCYCVEFIDNDLNFSYWNVYPQEFELI